MPFEKARSWFSCQNESLSMNIKQSLLHGLALIACFWAATAKAEEIKSYDISINLAKNSNLTVEEKILYDFGAEYKHGVYRYIPANYTGENGQNKMLFMELKSVTDENGSDYPVKATFENGNKVWRVGDPDNTVTGQKTYVFKYEALNGMRYFPDHTELYWNATGNQWPVAIDHVRVQVKTPAPVREIVCYTGPAGSAVSNCQKFASGDTAAFTADSLGYNEGLTFAIKLDANAVDPPPAHIRAIAWLASYGGYVLLVPLVLIAWYLMWRFGSDPNVSRSVMPRYKPPTYPDGEVMKPGVLGTLIDESADMVDITATIIDLARRGYFVIKEIPKSGIFGSKDWEFERHNSDLTGLKPYEQTVMNGIFTSGDTQTLSGLRNHFYVHVAIIKKQFWKELVDKKCYIEDPSTTRAKYVGCSVLVFGASAVIAGGLSVAAGSIPVSAIFLGLAGLVVSVMMYKIMPKRSIQGVMMLKDVQGLEEFITRAKEDQIHFLESQGKDLFEPLLPYALAMGVAKQWAGRFSHLDFQPTWYQGTGQMNTFYFLNSMNSFSSAAGSSLSVAPSSSGSSSGFGGGFSGGGGGGGGGGSW